MPTIHAARLRVSEAAFTRLRETAEMERYSAKRKGGYIIDENHSRRLSGRFYYTKVKTTHYVNPETLEDEKDESVLMYGCRFRCDQAMGLISVRDRRSDLQILEDQFNGYTSVRVEIEDFNVDLVELYRAMAGSGGKVDARSVKIADYYSPTEGIATKANFAIRQPDKQDVLFDRYGDEIKALTMNVIVEGKRLALSVTRTGTIKYHEDLPLDVLEMCIHYLKLCHIDAVEVTSSEG